MQTLLLLAATAAVYALCWLAARLLGRWRPLGGPFTQALLPWLFFQGYLVAGLATGGGLAGPSRGLAAITTAALLVSAAIALASARRSGARTWGTMVAWAAPWALAWFLATRPPAG